MRTVFTKPIISIRRILAFIILFAILTAGWWVTPSQSEEIPLCFIKTVFHFDCPGCGLTRSFLALARGHFLLAFQYNAAGPLVYLLFFLYFLETIAGFLREGYRFHYPNYLSKSYGITVVVLLFGHWFFRLHHQFFY